MSGTCCYHNARLIDARGERTGDVYIENGRIAAIGEKRQAAHVVDAGGLVLMPALIDMHCHLRDPGYPEKEDMQSGMRAALQGGFSLLCAMANTNPVCQTPAQVDANHKKAEALQLCRLIQAAAAGVGLQDAEPTDYAALRAHTIMLTNDGNTIASDSFMRNLLQASKQYGFVISTHCQPERQIVARDIALLREVSGNLHVGHISHRETLAMIREAKKEGLFFTCEVTPHHLFGYDCAYKVNPPLRTGQDVRALLAGVMDGTIDCLATDHAPHTPADKANGMAGISNIEHALQIFLEVFHQNNIPLHTLSKMASYAPAKRLGLSSKMGLLEVGYVADMILLNPDGKHTLSCGTMVSRSHNTPFEGRVVRGRVHQTMIGGEVRYEY